MLAYHQIATATSQVKARRRSSGPPTPEDMRAALLRPASLGDHAHLWLMTHGKPDRNRAPSQGRIRKWGRELQKKGHATEAGINFWARQFGSKGEA